MLRYCLMRGRAMHFRRPISSQSFCRMKDELQVNDVVTKHNPEVKELLVQCKDELAQLNGNIRTGFSFLSCSISAICGILMAKG
jgi:hypothetical protein